MLALGPSHRALTPQALASTGGFVWWYVDLVSPSGDGVVLIWSFGLPFLPGRESAARRGEGLAARAQPSVALSVYRAGQPALYLLHAADPGEVDLASGEARIGESVFRSWVEEGSRRARARLRLPIPGGGFVEGGIELQGRPLRVPDGPEGDHVWCPLTTACSGRVDLSVEGSDRIVMEGRAYHDCNGSVLPLSGLGIAEWAWGREAADTFDEVHYVLWPESGEPPTAHLLRLHAEGAVEHEAADVVGVQRAVGWFGMPWHKEIALRGRTTGRERVVRPGALVDDGPFYVRSLLGQGMAEWVRPARVDAWWSRPFVRMAVSQEGANSVLLPFFAGPRDTRWRRLLGVAR